VLVRRHLFKLLRLADPGALRDRQRFAALRRTFYAGLWNAAATRLGGRCSGMDFGFQRISRNGLDIVVRGGELRLDDQLTLDLMGNKLLTFRLLGELGCAVPRHARFRFGELSPALDMMARSGRPIVVKPLCGSGGGNGVTTGITSHAGLRRAALAALAYDSDLLAEEQIEGHSYRLLFFDGSLVDAVRRDPPRLTGDGHASIARLARAETERRLKATPAIAMNPLGIDREARHYLAAQGLSPRAVPATGETVVLKRAVNQNGRSENHVVANLHAATVTRCGQLARRLGVRLAGVDIIAHDIALPLTPDNGVIGEINTTPALHHHELVAGPRAFGEITADLLERMFAARAGVIVRCEDSGLRPRRRLEVVS
jgi:D-alanine-D-alanine ligase-like ATP-grasp enzyme